MLNAQVLQDMLVPTHHLAAAAEFGRSQMYLFMGSRMAVTHALRGLELYKTFMLPESLNYAYQRLSLAPLLPICSDTKLKARLQQHIKAGRHTFCLLTGREYAGLLDSQA